MRCGDCELWHDRRKDKPPYDAGHCGNILHREREMRFFGSVCMTTAETRCNSKFAHKKVTFPKK